MSLIPDSAKREMEESDKRRRESARRVSTSAQFARSFQSEYAEQIEMIRRGAIVTETVAEQKQRLGQANTITAEDFNRPAAVAMPDGKKVPTRRQALVTIRWAQFKRAVRNYFTRLWDAVKQLWRALWTR